MNLLGDLTWARGKPRRALPVAASPARRPAQKGSSPAGCALLACSPCSVPPLLRFVFLDLRFTLRASFPRSVVLTQLRFTSFVVINLLPDSHRKECAHAGRNRHRGPPSEEAPLPHRGGSGCLNTELASISGALRV